MPKKISEIIEGQIGFSGRLPLTHNTDVAVFHKIVASGKIEPVENKKYDNENLLFLFYGRPSYRPNLSAPNLSVKSFAPICVVVRRDLLTSIKRLHALDTGAFKSGSLTPPIHPTMGLDDFRLHNGPSSIEKLIEFYFENEEKYFSGLPKISTGTDPFDEIISDAYEKLIRRQSNQELDDRVSAIEIQTEMPIDIEREVLAIVLPSQFYVVPEIQKFFSKNANITPLLYSLPETYKPSEAHFLVYNKVREYYTQEGIL
jgi:hypothetical protein